MKFLKNRNKVSLIRHRICKLVYIEDHSPKTKTKTKTKTETESGIGWSEIEVVMIRAKSQTTHLSVAMH